MKYSVLVALLGTSSAVQLQGEPERSGQTTQYDEFGPSEKTQNLMPRAYERSANSNKVDGVRVSRTTFYSQLEDQMNMDTPDESRKAWQTTRDASRQEVSDQEKFMKEHNANVAKNYADDVAKTNEKKWKDSASRINMMNGGTTPFKTVTNAPLKSKYAQISTPDESRAAWQSTRDASRAAVAEQERFQKEHNAMVAKNYADDVAATNKKKWHDAASGINMKNGGTTPFKTVTNAKLDTMYAQTSTPDESRAAWQATRDASRAAAAEQERFQLEHNKMVAKNYADDVASTNTKKWHDAASRINMMNGGTTPFKTVTNAKLNTMYAQGPLGPSDTTFIPSKETAAAVVAAQQAFEKKSGSNVAAANAKAIAEANALKEKVRAARTIQAGGDVGHNPYPTRESWTGQPANRAIQALSQYIDGSHPVSIYETNGADSNRDHPSAQVPGPKLSTQQQGWESHGNSHYWATEDNARQQGWSNEINPWTKPLTHNNDVNLDKSKSLYTSLVQLQDNEADKSFNPSKAAASAVTSTQQAFEAKKTADVAERNAKNVAATNAVKNAVNLNTKESRWGFVNYP